MANVIPFKGTRYNAKKIKDISKVVAPPYDVISPEEQEGLYNLDPHNIIRILLGKDFPDDNEKENKYIRAVHFLRDWQNNDILKKERLASIYIYLQQFNYNGTRKNRLGFIALLKLEEFDKKTSTIYPHENTLCAPKEDRTKLISSIEANLGPIFALFADEHKTIDSILAEETKSMPLIDIIDKYGIRHKLWRFSDKGKVTRIIRLMYDKKIFIADGHHRYEVALEFSKLKKDSKYGYILTYFTDLYGDGIVILPVHRLISGVSDDALSNLKENLPKDFAIEQLSDKEDVKTFLSDAMPSEKRFAIYHSHAFIGVKVKDSRDLDASVIHDLVIEPLRRRSEAQGDKISIDFTKDLDYAIREVDSKRFSLSIILNPTRVTEVRDMAFSGKRMPQKSTYFYPKVLTGLVINVF
jgi:uncharacterized protein (DUF1015 family)